MVPRQSALTLTPVRPSSRYSMRPPNTRPPEAHLLACRPGQVQGRAPRRRAPLLGSGADARRARPRALRACARRCLSAAALRARRRSVRRARARHLRPRIHAAVKLPLADPRWRCQLARARLRTKRDAAYRGRRATAKCRAGDHLARASWRRRMSRLHRSTACSVQASPLPPLRCSGSSPRRSCSAA